MHLYTLLEERILYRILKGSISAMYLEPLQGSKQEKRFYMEHFVYILICFVLFGLNISYY